MFIAVNQVDIWCSRNGSDICQQTYCPYDSVKCSCEFNNNNSTYTIWELPYGYQCDDLCPLSVAYNKSYIRLDKTGEVCCNSSNSKNCSIFNAENECDSPICITSNLFFNIPPDWTTANISCKISIGLLPMTADAENYTLSLAGIYQI